MTDINLDIQSEIGPTFDPTPEPPTLTQRLHWERLEVERKIAKLKTFITTDEKFKHLSWKHQDLLEQQLENMARYEGNLVERMVLINKEESPS